MRKVILDVGCGDDAKGDINVDLSLNTMQIIRNQKKSIRTSVNIVADGNYLPFKNNSFDKVMSHHVIEHTKTPFKFLSELIRVSKNEVEIKCPHKLSRDAKTAYHVSFFNKTWFGKACEALSPEIRYSVKVTLDMFKIGYLTFPFTRPDEITVRIRMCGSYTRNYRQFK